MKIDKYHIGGRDVREMDIEGILGKDKEKEEQQAPQTQPVQTQADQITLDKICRNYERFMNETRASDSMASVLPKAQNIVLNSSPTKQMIEQFCFELTKYKKGPSPAYKYFSDFTSSYLTALMQASSDNDFVLDLRDVFLNWIAYHLKGKNIVIRGNVGSCLGYDAEDCVIKVEGDVGEKVGHDARNCKIEISGRFENLGFSVFKDTEIYCQGKRVWPQ
ncbi:hypothetical protein HZA33_00640 [Candidatus Pacearchaeota archaeon]|nr:hypothetical protein [Candidatus Pacearchaeota archaeon]